ncbi:hypothetical protein C725_2729 [Pacificimonas flava]|uniref:Uncharacterized protein n=1 Tax=Pacificimonas flava TaxID=1234595 RepID=M2S989_9SPHN|nr:hypothetical protein C725_2729 [Pacificimonas flava]
MTILGEADIDLRPRRGHHIAVRKMPGARTRFAGGMLAAGMMQSIERSA